MAGGTTATSRSSNRAYTSIMFHVLSLTAFSRCATALTWTLESRERRLGALVVHYGGLVHHDGTDLLVITASQNSYNMKLFPSLLTFLSKLQVCSTAVIVTTHESVTILCVRRSSLAALSAGLDGREARKEGGEKEGVGLEARSTEWELQELPVGSTPRLDNIVQVIRFSVCWCTCVIQISRAANYVSGLV